MSTTSSTTTSPISTGSSSSPSSSSSRYTTPSPTSPDSSWEPLVITRSLHSSTPHCLSTYKRKWWLTLPCPPSSSSLELDSNKRIYCSLNRPDWSASPNHAQTHFWLNDELGSQPYECPEDLRDISILHVLLESEPPIARLTGNTRMEKPRAACLRDREEILCYEIEVLVPDSGLLRQCYYCSAFEGVDTFQRFRKCGNELYSCSQCQSGKYLKPTNQKAWKELWQWTVWNLSATPGRRDSLYM